MYIGIGPESKKRVLEEDAFSYACDRIYSGRPTAIRILKDTAGKIWQIRSM